MPNSARSPSYWHCNQQSMAYVEDNLCHWTCQQTSSFPERYEPKRARALLSLGTSVSGIALMRTVHSCRRTCRVPCQCWRARNTSMEYYFLVSREDLRLCVVCLQSTKGPIIAVMNVQRVYSVHRYKDLLQLSCVYTVPTVYTDTRTHYSCHVYIACLQCTQTQGPIIAV